MLAETIRVLSTMDIPGVSRIALAPCARRHRHDWILPAILGDEHNDRANRFGMI
jgi:hypothetical protein